MKSGKHFFIQAAIDGKTENISVTELETTDGVPYYSCKIDEQEITQIRNEVYGPWEQLWGELDAKTVDTLGKAITKKLQEIGQE